MKEPLPIVIEHYVQMSDKNKI